MLNYGQTLENLNDDKILARLKYWNCEWLSCPNIVISEMVSTLKDNLDTLQWYKGTVFTDAFIDELTGVVQPIEDQLKCLDNQDRSTHEPPNQDDVMDVLKAIHEKQEVEELFMAAFNATGPVIMMAIQALAINTLLHNPPVFPNKAMRCPATQEFKANPNDDTMMQYLLSSILMRRRSVQHSRSLFDRTRYEADDQPTSSSSQERSSRASKRLDRSQSSGWQRPVSSTSTPRSRLRTAAPSRNRPTSTPGRRTSTTSTSRSLPFFSVTRISGGTPPEEDDFMDDTPPASAPTPRQCRPWVPESECQRQRITGELNTDDDDEDPEVAEVSPSPLPPPSPPPHPKKGNKRATLQVEEDEPKQKKKHNNDKAQHKQQEVVEEQVPPAPASKKDKKKKSQNKTKPWLRDLADSQDRLYKTLNVTAKR